MSKWEGEKMEKEGRIKRRNFMRYIDENIRIYGKGKRKSSRNKGKEIKDKNKRIQLGLEIERRE